MTGLKETVAVCNSFTFSNAHTGIPEYCQACLSILFNIGYMSCTLDSGKTSASFAQVWLDAAINIKIHLGNVMEITYHIAPTVTHYLCDVPAVTAKQ